MALVGFNARPAISSTTSGETRRRGAAGADFGDAGATRRVTVTLSPRGRRRQQDSRRAEVDSSVRWQLIGGHRAAKTDPARPDCDRHAGWRALIVNLDGAFITAIQQVAARKQSARWGS